jgi:protein-arginine deiminase
MQAPPRVRARVFNPLMLVLLLTTGCEPFVDDGDTSSTHGPGSLTGAFEPVVDLRADVNRDGVVELGDPADDMDEDTWSADRGAIFLANIDDDASTCDYVLAFGAKSEEALVHCNDALDSWVNGEQDLEDLARLRTAPWPEAPEGARGIVTVSGAAAGKVRLFKAREGGFVSQKVRASGFVSQEEPHQVTLTARELREGVELAIEATDIVRDTSVWDGYADVVFTVTRGRPEEEVHDTVRLRVAPVVMFHHLTPALNVYVSRIPGDPESMRFRQELAGALEEAGPRLSLFEYGVEDLWAQDYFEPAYMAMPAAGGRQHVIQVNYRAAFVYKTQDGDLPRAAGRIVYWLRGPDQAAVQQFTPGQSRESQTLNSMGNTEVIPPYEKDGVKYPLGRLLRGRGPDTRPDFQPDPGFSRMLEAQAVQPPVYMDTSWLDVGHVDEVFNFLPANTPRGWIVLVADPAEARRILVQAQEQGHGRTKLLAGLTWGFDRPAELSIAQVLNHPGVMDGSAQAALEIDTQLSLLKEATGITDEDIVRVPFLFHEVPGGVTAYQPATVNLLAVSPTLVIAPDPHGPLIDGKDPFKARMEEALARYGIRVRWSEVWDLYHRGGGQMHCATNSAREVPQTPWWEGGR